jgi:hypothetical protein
MTLSSAKLAGTWPAPCSRRWSSRFFCLMKFGLALAILGLVIARAANLFA